MGSSRLSLTGKQAVVGLAAGVVSDGRSQGIAETGTGRSRHWIWLGVPAPAPVLATGTGTREQLARCCRYVTSSKAEDANAAWRSVKDGRLFNAASDVRLRFNDGANESAVQQRTAIRRAGRHSAKAGPLSAASPALPLRRYLQSVASSDCRFRSVQTSRHENWDIVNVQTADLPVQEEPVADGRLARQVD